MRNLRQIGGSFRDPSGSTFLHGGEVYRQINACYRQNFESLMTSGLYDDLVAKGLLVPHTDVSDRFKAGSGAYKLIRPEQLPFISYPYEWCFSQLKDAALATLDIMKYCMSYGMILKDASAYNIQFRDCRPILIDTLSFEIYVQGRPWIAYKQFCQHFLVPLVLMSRRDIRLSQLLRVHIDGVPLDMAAAMLPKRTWLNSGIALHVHLHARAQRRYAATTTRDSQRSKRLDKRSLIRIVDHLRSTVAGLSWKHGNTSWSNYYAGDSYIEAGLDHKKELVAEYLSIANPACVWDLGANTGVYSRIAAEQGAYTVSIDNDPGVVETNYLRCKRDSSQDIQPLLIDFTNPSAGIGWANAERDSLVDRRNADCLLALALIHHLAISNNVPLDMTAEYFSALAEWLIIEFVPKHDKKVQQLLASREDIFPMYTREGFEEAYCKHYELARSQNIQSSNRILYLFRRH